MDVLVAYGGGEDAGGIAARVTTRLRSHGLAVGLKSTAAVEDVEAYGAVVVGGETTRSHWVRAARRFVRQHEEELARRPVWLFSCGGPDVDAGPKEFDDFLATIEPEDETVLDDDADPRLVAAWADGVAARLQELRRDRAIDVVHEISIDALHR